MRFTSLSTLTNTLFISAVALVSLIPAANAFVFVTFTDPGPGTSYHAGDTMLVKWFVNTTTTEDDISGVTATLRLVNEALGVNQSLSGPVPSFMGGVGQVFISTDTHTSNQYIIQAVTEKGTFGSNTFTIHKVKH